MQDFRNVGSWIKAHAVVLRIYRETGEMPREEIFGVTTQLRRSAIAVASRIAEGCGRDDDADFAVDLRKAAATCNELEYLVLVARDLQLWKSDIAEQLTVDVVEVRKMIYGLLRKF